MFATIITHTLLVPISPLIYFAKSSISDGGCVLDSIDQIYWANTCEIRVLILRSWRAIFCSVFFRGKMGQHFVIRFDIKQKSYPAKSEKWCCNIDIFMVQKCQKNLEGYRFLLLDSKHPPKASNIWWGFHHFFFNCLKFVFQETISQDSVDNGIIVFCYQIFRSLPPSLHEYASPLESDKSRLHKL